MCVFKSYSAGDVEGLIDDTVEGGREEGSGEGGQGSVEEEEDSDDEIQKKEKRKRCKHTIFHGRVACTMYTFSNL